MSSNIPPIIYPSTSTTKKVTKTSMAGYDPSIGSSSNALTNQNLASASNRKISVSILDKNLNRKTPEVSLSSVCFLFAEVVSWAHSQSKGIQQLEQRLNSLGYHIGQRILELITFREGKTAKREIKLVEILQFIHGPVWKSLFNKNADGLEKSQDTENEYMITDNCPLISKFISVPKEFGQLNCSAYVAGIIEGLLDSAYFQANVTAHTVPKDDLPLRTVYLIKFDKSVLERELIRFSKN